MIYALSTRHYLIRDRGLVIDFYDPNTGRRGADYAIDITGISPDGDITNRLRITGISPDGDITNASSWCLYW